MFKRILVAVEFEEKVGELLSATAGICIQQVAQAWIVHVAAPQPEFVGLDVGPQYIRDLRAEDLRAEHRLLQRYTGMLADMGIEAEGLLVQGPTVETLLAEADKLDVDLIVIGNHAHGMLYKAFLGSTTDSIIHQTEVPVLVIPLED